MIVKICVGSSCHLKGSYGVIETLQEVVARLGVVDKVTLQASFCLGCCADGVTLRCEPVADCLDDEVVMLHHATAENVEQLFVTEVLPRL